MRGTWTANMNEHVICIQVSQGVGAAQSAHGLRKMHAHLGSKQLSEQQLHTAVNLAESLVASLEEVRPGFTKTICCPSS